MKARPKIGGPGGWWASLSEVEYEAHCARLSAAQRARLGDKVLPDMSEVEKKRYWKLRDRNSGLGIDRAAALAVVMAERAVAWDAAHAERVARQRRLRRLIFQNEKCS